MNPRSPRTRIDAILFVSVILAILWRTLAPAPAVDDYIVESQSVSQSRIDNVNFSLEMYLAVVESYLADQNVSRLLSVALVVLMGLFVAMRARRVFLHSARFTERICPVCGGPIVRVRRSGWHRVMEKLLFLPTQNYHCQNPDCGWTGLRYGGSDWHSHW